RKSNTTLKRNLLISSFLVFATIAFGQVSKTVYVASAGTLSTLMTTVEANTITNLTVTGNIDARDVAFMRDNITLLSLLDLGSANIKAYTGIDGTYTLATIAYPINELPLCAFYNASTLAYKSTLTSIKLPSTLTSIGGSAFYYCYGLSGTFTIPAKVSSIGSYALYGCSALSAYVVETTNTRYSSNNGVLFNKKQDSLFICPSAKTGAYSIPSNVTYIGASAFDYCYNLTGNLTIPSSVNTIGSYAFYYCSGFTGSLTIPATVTTISDGTFYGCSGLSGTVTIPKSVSSIGSYAFFECNKLTSFQVDALNPIYSSSNDVLFTKTQDTLLICPGAKTGSYVIPSTVKGIGSYGFYNCSGLTGNLVIPKSVGSIGSYAFYGCTQLSAYEVDPLNTKYLSNNGVLFNKNQDSLLVCPSGKTGSYTIPSGVKSIGTYSFYYCSGLTGSINIPSSVNAIGDYAFYGCNQLTAFEVEATNSIYASNDGVLLNHAQDTLFICPVGKTGKYTIPNTIKAIGYSAFDACVGLTEIIFPITVSSIGSYAFEYCTGLIQTTLPINLTSIGSGAFYSCSNLQKFSIMNPIPPSIDYLTFSLVDKTTCQLLVPIGSLVAYQNSSFWKEFTFAAESSFTAVQNQTVNPVKVYGYQQQIVVEGLTSGEMIEVFTLDGKQIHTAKTNGNTLSINAKKGEIYLVKTKDKMEKVLL
ncbi:MAG TPA: leucine-rich repeat domain-containing protein, partial [Paludibacter sp.]